jgi:phosphoribosylformylglycinamidine cyclo-ligase
MTKPLDYKQSGVNVAAGDDASRILFQAAVQTWENRKGRIGEVLASTTDFRTTRYFTMPKVSDGLCLGLNFDGVGTKVELAERLNSHRGLAFDLLAMVCDDAAAQFAEPIQVGSILDMSCVDIEIVQEVASGMVDAARAAEVAIINGELAELGSRVGGYGRAPLNWGAACLWVAEAKELTRSRVVVPGDAIIGIAERSFRANGYSLIRAIFRRAFGESWGTRGSKDGIDMVRFAAQPSTIYAPSLVSLHRSGGSLQPDDLRAFIPVTGGGLLGRVRHFCKVAKVGALIDSPIEPPQEMSEIRELGKVDVVEAYRTWNQGIGMLVVVADSAATAVKEQLAGYGHRAEIIGRVTAGTHLEMRLHGGQVHHEDMPLP